MQRAEFDPSGTALIHGTCGPIVVFECSFGLRWHIVAKPLEDQRHIDL